MPLAKSNLHDYVHCREYVTKPWRFKLEIALGIAEGLRYLHRHYIIHCDLHSGHILIDQVSIIVIICYFSCIIFLLKVGKLLSNFKRRMARPVSLIFD